jgi:hypothetical protein
MKKDHFMTEQQACMMLWILISDEKNDCGEKTSHINLTGMRGRSSVIIIIVDSKFQNFLSDEESLGAIL